MLRRRRHQHGYLVFVVDLDLQQREHGDLFRRSRTARSSEVIEIIIAGQSRSTVSECSSGLVVTGYRQITRYTASHNTSESKR